MLQAASLHSSANCFSHLGLLIETQFANFKSKERRGSFSQREKLSLIKSPRNRKSSKSVIRMAFKSLKLSWIASTFRLEMQIKVTWMRFLHKPSHAHFWLIKLSSLLSQKCLFEGLSKSLVTSLCLSKKHGLIKGVSKVRSDYKLYFAQSI